MTLAPSGIEGRITFQATVLLPNQLSHTPENSIRIINEQTKHLMGLFELAEFATFINVDPNEHLGVMGLGALDNVKILKEISP